VATGVLRLADQIAAAGGTDAMRMEQGTITVVAAGAALDGNAKVTVSWRGTSIFCPYPSTYTPVVGHVVLLLIQPPQVVIVARLIGTPA
jgi:hypothetical protein